MSTYTEISSIEEVKQNRERRNRVMVLLLLLLLLLVLTLGILFYLLLGQPLTAPQQKGGLKFYFSIYGLKKPLFASADNSGKIYVSDTGNGRVLVFDDQGRFVTRIGSGSRESRTYSVYGSYIDQSANNLYLADYTDNVIHVFNPRSGQIKFRFPAHPADRTFGVNGFTPFGIAEYQNKLYITSNDGVYIFSKKGKLLSKWAGRGRGLDQFDFPNGIAIDQKSGTIFVTDVLNRRVKAMNSKGVVKWVIGKPDEGGNIVGFFSLPRGIALNNQQGYLYVSDTFANRIVVLDTEGRLISIIGKRGLDDGQFNFPEGLNFTADGKLLVADRENNRIEVLRPTSFPPPSKTDLDKYKMSYITANN